MIYLDHAATTPVDPRVAAAMADVLAAGDGNPAASHAAGRAAAARIADARADIAALVGVEASAVVLTSGATEANNLAIFGHAQGWLTLRGQPGHLLSLTTEHKSVLEPLRRLKSQGWRLTLLTPGRDGVLDPAALDAALAADTALVSVLHVNNETGVVQDIAAIAACCRARRVALHVDAVQAVGKLPVDARGIDYLTFSAHKIGGPQGIGALVVAPERRVLLAPQMLGGGQEHGLRSGTPATHQIAGFAAACRIQRTEGAAAAARMTEQRERLWQGLADLPRVERNGHASRRVAGILNVTFAGVEGESLLAGLGGIAVATGSACDSASGEASFVLRALGHDREAAQSSLRFSLGPGTSAADIDTAVAAVRETVLRLTLLSPASPPPTADWVARGARVVSGEAGARRHGAWVRWWWRIDADRIAEVRWQAWGGPTLLAAVQHVASRLAGHVPGAPLPGTPADWLTAVAGPVEKLGRMLIIEDAARAALAAWSPE